MDWMLANPQGRYADCAQVVGVSENWISIVANSEVFKVELARRRAVLEEGITMRLSEVALQALVRLGEAIERSEDPWFLLRATDVLLKHMGKLKQSDPAVAHKHNLVTINHEDLQRARELARQRY